MKEEKIYEKRKIDFGSFPNVCTDMSHGHAGGRSFAFLPSAGKSFYPQCAYKKLEEGNKVDKQEGSEDDSDKKDNCCHGKLRFW